VSRRKSVFLSSHCIVGLGMVVHVLQRLRQEDWEFEPSKTLFQHTHRNVGEIAT
jgi:hypothetical protein